MFVVTKPKNLLIILTVFCLCIQLNGQAEEYIADYKVSKESVLRQIPASYIEAAKNNLHIMYCGTSHSSQVVDGMRGLMEYKTGDNTLFAVTFNGTPVPGALDIHYRPSSVYTASDLSNDTVDANGKTAYYYRTIEYLDNPSYADVNVVMWSWCSIDGHNVQIYLDNFAALIDMYRAGGSKGRTAANEVKFVFMTGYASGDDGDTPEPPYIYSPYQNHKRIVDYCRSHNYFCLDYWSQDTYEYETDAYKPTEDGNDNVQHLAYVNSHVLGQDWYECRDFDSGAVSLPAHANQHLTGNRRAYAAWWIWARLAGWSGNNSSSKGKPDFNNDGQADILWRYYGVGGYNTVWLRGTGTSSPALDRTAASGDDFTGVQSPGAIDFNGDAEEEMSRIMAATVTDPRDDPEAVDLPAASNSLWKLCGSGDFNNDGKPDLVWRHMGNGTNAVWFMDGVTRTSVGWLPTAASLDWTLCCTGDFNNDGKIDLVWRNISSGANSVWFMDGLTRTGVGSLPSAVNLDWTLAAAGDFNNDNKPDLVWRNMSSGVNAVWFMDGLTRTSVGWLPTAASVNWTLSGCSDFNNDGKCDLLWQNTSIGSNAIWYMDGLVRTSVEFLTTVTNTTWKIEN